ncbi:hypothetical protein ACO0SA_001134 [Hanseniaspora valbyensis]
MIGSNNLISQNSSTNVSSRDSLFSNNSNNTSTLNNNSIWKYYKLYDDEVVKTSNLTIPFDSSNNIVRLIPSKNTVIYTTTTANKEISIFDNKSNKFIITNFNINDTDIDSHILIDLKVVENIEDNMTFVIVIAENVNSNNNINSPYIIKIYNYDDIITSVNNNIPLKYHTMVTINDTIGKNKYPITQFIINNELNIALLGLGNGNVYLIRGDLKRDRGYKQRLIYKTLKQQPITNLKFINDSTQVIASTVDKVLILNTDGKISSKHHLETNYFKVINDKEGCSLNLIDSFNDNTLLLLNDGFVNVYSFKNGFTRTDSIALNVGYKSNEPLLLKCLNKNEILILSKIISNNPTEFIDSYKLSIIDLNNHVTTLNAIFNSSIKDIIDKPSDNQFEIILQTGKKHIFKQKSIHEMLNIILKQTSLSDFEFKLAINFLKERNEKTDEVLRKYGDFLFAQNRTSEAMQQYINCIDYFMDDSDDFNSRLIFENDDNSLPSITDIVIKFAMQKKETLLNDNENLTNLIKFLKRLIHKDFETKPDYITLLMILFIKLNKWDDFVDLINKLDRKGKYCEDKATSYDAYHSFSIEEDEDYWYSDIVTFDVQLITQLLIETIGNNDNEYDTEIQELLFKITVKFNRDPEKIVSVLLNELELYKFTLNWIQRLDPAGLMNIIFGPLGIGRLLLDIDYKNNAGNDYVIDLYVQLFTGKYKQVSIEQKKIVQTYQPPKPSIIFNFFINHSEKFALFLEQLISSDTIENKTEYGYCVNALYSTYINLKLDAKAQKLYDENKDIISELMLADFKPTKDEISTSLSLAIRTNNITKVIEIEQDKQTITKELLIKILRYVTSKQTILTEYTEERLTGLVKYLLGKDYLSMSELIMVLSETNVVSFGVIKPLLIKWVVEKQEEIDTQKKELETFEKKMDTKNKDINTVNNNDACFTCELPIKPPYYKFNCGHLAHKTCVNQSDNIVCPSCGSSLEAAAENVNKINSFSQNNDTEIEESLNSVSGSVEKTGFGFNVLLDLISKGALEIQ